MKKIAKILSIGVLMAAINLLAARSVAQNSDPTQPPDILLDTRTASSSGHFELSAIFLNKTKPQAIINDRLVSLGSKLNEFTITAITPYTVELKGIQGRRLVLTLTPPVKKEVTEN